MNVTPGAWYLGVTCPKCSTPIPLWTVPADAPNPQIVGPGKLRVPCPHCGETSDYGTEQVARFQAQQTH